MAEQANELREIAEKLAAALRPFLREMPDDDMPDHLSWDAHVSYAEMRAARAALLEAESAF